MRRLSEEIAKEIKEAEADCGTKRTAPKLAMNSVSFAGNRLARRNFIRAPCHEVTKGDLSQPSRLYLNRGGFLHAKAKELEPNIFALRFQADEIGDKIVNLRILNHAAPCGHVKRRRGALRVERGNFMLTFDDAILQL